MSFKSLIFSFFVLTSFTGCSWWGGDLPDNSVIKLNEKNVLENSACIDEVGAFFSNYFSGTTTEAEINRNFLCINNTMDTIFENAIEKNVDKGFTKGELSQILETIFPRKEKIFLNDNIEVLYLLKRIFVGGALDGFNRADHRNLVSVLPKIKFEFIKSRQEVKHIFLGSKMTFAARIKGFDQLRLSFKSLDQIRSDAGGELTEPEAITLIEQIFKSEGISKYKGLAYMAKTFVYNDEPEVFNNSQKDFFERLINVFEVQAKLRSLDFKKGFLFGKSFYDLESAVLMTSRSLTKWAGADSRWYIDVKSVGDILKASRDAGFWEDKFSDPDLVSLSIKKMLSQIFEKERLDLSSMKKLDQIFTGWVTRQESIISKYKFPWIENKKNTKLDSESLNIVEEVESFKFPQFVSESNAPITIKRRGNTLVPAKLYFDQSLKHLLISTANEVFKAYSSVQPFTKDAPRQRITLTLPDVTRIFNDIRPLGLEFGFNDPHHCGSEKRVVIEADSFTLSGNGDNRVSIRESVEWLATMISVASVSNQVFNRIEESCSLPGMKVLGSSFLGRKCALNQVAGDDQMLRDHFPDAFNYVDMLKSDTRRESFEKRLGGLADWFDKVKYKKETANDFLTNRFDSSNTCSDKDNFPYSKREFNTSFAINIYVENFFYQFDKSGVDSWWPGTTDPSGSDFIIDGGELSKFFKAKATSLMDTLVPIYKDAHWSTRHFSDNRVKRTLRNLPENANYMDRSRVFQLLKMFLSVDKEEDRHPFADKYCRDVSRTQDSSIFYRQEDRLMCLPNEK